MCEKHPVYMSHFVDHKLSKLWSCLRDVCQVNGAVFPLNGNGWLVHLRDNLLGTIKFDSFINK